jgi:hypothetical protein
VNRFAVDREGAKGLIVNILLMYRDGKIDYDTAGKIMFVIAQAHSLGSADLDPLEPPMGPKGGPAPVDDFFARYERQMHDEGKG